MSSVTEIPHTATPAPSSLTYRQGILPDDVPAIMALLEAHGGPGMYWPGAAATPYVACDPSGAIVGVFFKTLCFHAEPVCAVPGAGVSVTALADMMKASFRELASELGYPLIVYSVVQDSDKARTAATKNGMVRSPGTLYEVSIGPEIQ